MMHETSNFALLRLRVPVAAALLFLTLSGATYAPRDGAAGGTSAPPAADAALPTLRLGGPPADPDTAGASAVESALAALAPHVTRMSAPGALRTAFEAYFAHRDAHPGEVVNPYLYFVDLGLSSTTPRGYVFDMRSQTVVEGPFPVAHGRGSGPRNGVPTKFSNRPGSYASSLGLYVARETYTFRGKSGGRRYTSVGLRMRGESGRFNGAALARGIVAHGAPYVSSVGAGRSEGCPAMEQARARRLLPLLANGGVVFLYSPNDGSWLRGDPWVNASILGVPVD